MDLEEKNTRPYWKYNDTIWVTMTAIVVLVLKTFLWRRDEKCRYLPSDSPGRDWSAGRRASSGCSWTPLLLITSNGPRVSRHQISTCLQRHCWDGARPWSNSKCEIKWDLATLLPLSFIISRVWLNIKLSPDSPVCEWKLFQNWSQTTHCIVTSENKRIVLLPSQSSTDLVA